MDLLEWLLFAASIIGILSQEDALLNYNATANLSAAKSNASFGLVENENEGDVAVFLFAGDISLGKPVRKGDGSSCLYEGILANVTEYFKGVDYNMVNLEAPFVSPEIAEKLYLPDKGIHNMAWKEGVKTLTSAGVKSVTVANNHITDYGSDGLRFTEMVLESYGIEVVGVTDGVTPPYSNQVPIIKIFNGVKVGILAYCADTSAECLRFRPHVDRGPALMYRETAEKDIADLKARVNIVVLYLHWGTEYMAIPGEEQRQLAVYLSGLGVNLIIGSHPHVLQGHEWINETLVHYSLGNFVFHPHYTVMRKLAGLSNRTGIHARMMEQAKLSRGPAGLTELFMVELEETGIKEAYFLPIRVHVSDNGCPYPMTRQEDWIRVCGPQDDNCYAPRNDIPVFLDVYEDSDLEK